MSYYFFLLANASLILWIVGQVFYQANAVKIKNFRRLPEEPAIVYAILCLIEMCKKFDEADYIPREPAMVYGNATVYNEAWVRLSS